MGCGTGKFPSLLSKAITFRNPAIIYDYLDPSYHSLNCLKNSLKPPFFPGYQYQTTLEDLPVNRSNQARYQIVWAIHSLYTLSPFSLARCINKISSLLNPVDGVGLVFLSTQNSFYMTFYEKYLEALSKKTELSSYLNAQMVTSTLRGMGIKHEIHSLHFQHSIHASDFTTLERYLSKCVFDSQKAEFWLENPVLRDYLQSFVSHGVYQFPQEVWLIKFGTNPLFKLYPPFSTLF